MKRLVRWAAALYPARWRKRYAPEFSALLEDLHPGWRDVFDILRGAVLMHIRMPKGGRVVAAGALAGLAVAAVVALRMPDQWVSTAVLRLEVPSGQAWVESLDLAQQEVLSRTSLFRIITGHGLYMQERQKEPLEDIVQEMRNKSIHIRMLPERGERERSVRRDADGNAHLPGARPSSIAISFEYPDREKAQAVTRDLAARLLERNLAAQLSEKTVKPLTLSVAAPATLPQTPASPRRFRIVIEGFAGGILLGLIVLGVHRWPLVAGCGAAGAALAFAASWLIPIRYTSTAVVALPDRDSAARLAQFLGDDMILHSAVEQFGLYPRERMNRSMEEILKQMRDDTRVQFVGPQGSAIAISYVSEADRFTAQPVVRELQARAIEMATAMRLAHAYVLDPPGLPETPLSPNRATWALVGLLAGLVLSAAWLALRGTRVPVTRHA